MSKWKIFGKSKKDECIEFQEPKTNDFNENTTMETENKQEVETPTDKKDDKPLAEHHDTIHAGKRGSKKGKSGTSSSDQRVWRDINAIEENIDNMHVSKSSTPPSEFDKKVDKIIKKKDKK